MRCSIDWEGWVNGLDLCRHEKGLAGTYSKMRVGFQPPRSSAEEMPLGRPRCCGCSRTAAFIIIIGGTGGSWSSRVS